MSFFDDIPRPPDAPRPEKRRMEPWSGPPAGWAGGWVPWHLVLAQTADVYCVVTDVEAFGSGVAFSLLSRFREGFGEAGSRAGRLPVFIGRPSPEGPFFGVGFADGSKAMLGAHRPREEEPIPPVLRPIGGSGGGRSNSGILPEMIRAGALGCQGDDQLNWPIQSTWS